MKIFFRPIDLRTCWGLIVILLTLLIQGGCIGIFAPAPASGADRDLPGSGVVRAFQPGPRAMAMGGAMTAVADDAYAVFYNPAGLTQGRLFEIRASLGAGSTNLEELFALRGIDPRVEDIDQLPVLVGAYSASGAAALNLIRMGVGVSGESTTRIENDGQRAFVENQALGTGYVSLAGNVPGDMAMSGELAVGASVKLFRGHYYSSQLEVENAHTNRTVRDLNIAGRSLDVGLLNRVTDRIRVGVLIRDLYATPLRYRGTKEEFLGLEEEGTPSDRAYDWNVPPNLTVGAAYDLPVIDGVLAVDVENYAEGDERHNRLRAGIEGRLLFLTARGGFHTNPSGPQEGKLSLSCGLGLNMGLATFNIGLSTAGQLDEGQVQISGRFPF